MCTTTAYKSINNQCWTLIYRHLHSTDHRMHDCMIVSTSTRTPSSHCTLNKHRQGSHIQWTQIMSFREHVLQMIIQKEIITKSMLVSSRWSAAQLAPTHADNIAFSRACPIIIQKLTTLKNASQQLLISNTVSTYPCWSEHKAIVSAEQLIITSRGQPLAASSY